MKYLFRGITTLTTIAFLVAVAGYWFVMYPSTGENVSKTGESLDGIIESTHEIANAQLGDIDVRLKALKIDIEKDLKEKSILPRAKVLLEDAKKERSKLKKTADDFYADSMTAARTSERLNTEKEGIVKNFKSWQEKARDLGLPKYGDATEEDKAKVFKVEMRTYTGGDIYKILTKYKEDVQKKDAEIARERALADKFKPHAEKIVSRSIPRLDKFIEELDSVIKDIEICQKLENAAEVMRKLDPNNTDDGIISELKRKLDKTTVLVEIEDSEERVRDGYDTPPGGSSFTITDDDLI